MTDYELKVNRIRESWKELCEKYRPCAAYIKIELLAGNKFRVTVDGVAYKKTMKIGSRFPLTYLEKTDKSPIPIPAEKVSFVVDFNERLAEPVGGIRVFFEQRVAHPNVFASGTLCTGTQTDHTSFVEIVEKALRVIIFDPNIARAALAQGNSVACSNQIDWYRYMKEEDNIPTVLPSHFFQGQGIRHIKGGVS